MFNLDGTWIDIYCPKCKYQFEIQLIDARPESKVYCHNCKSIIQLQDNEVSVHRSTRDINRVLNDLDKT